MRRGVLAVGDDDRKTLLDDMAMMPRMIGGFVALAPMAAWKAVWRQRPPCPQV